MDLKDKKCITTKAPLSQLDEQSKSVYLSQIAPHWELLENGSRLGRNYGFKNFKQALNFVNQLSHIAEQENHHPEICFGWGYCKIKLWTHVNNDLHENDFILAAKIEELFNHL